MSITEGGDGLRVEQDPGGGLANPSSTNLSTDLIVAVAPIVYTPFITATLTTLLPASYLKIEFYVSASLAGSAVNRAINFRFLRNGVLIPPSRGTTENEISGSIMSLVFLRRLPVTAGAHVVLAEWAYFGPAGGTLQCRPAGPGILSDLEGAQLILEEQR